MSSRFSLEASLSMIDKFTGPLNKMSGRVDSFSQQIEKSFGSVNATLSRVQARTSSMAKEMQPLATAGAAAVYTGQQIAGAGKSILGAFGAVIDEGSAFEKTMSDVAAVARVDKTSQAFKDLENTAMDLGASTKYTASQVGEGMKFLAMAGFDATQQMKAMPDMLKLATVGNIDLATAADIASNTLGAFKMDASEMNRVANVMSATMTRSNVDMLMLADTFKYAAPIANAVGMSIEDLAAMTGLLGDVGIQGSMAGTALRASMIRLAAPPKMAADALRQLGVSTSDANGNLRGLPSILEDIRKKTAGMGSAQRLDIISSIFGAEASAAMTELVSKADESGKSIESFAESIKLAAQADELSTVARNMADNVEGAGLAFDSAASAVKIGIFNSFKDVWKKILQFGSKVLLMVYDFIKANPTLAKWISIIAATIGVLLVVLGSLITFGGLVAGAFVAMKIAAAAFGLTLSGAIWPVTLIVAAIAGLIAGVYLLISYWDHLMNFFRGTPGIIQTILAVLFPFVTIPLMIAANWDWLSGKLAEIWAWMKQTAANLTPDWLVAAWEWAYNKVMEIIDGIKGAAEVTGSFLGFDKWHGNEQETKAKIGPTGTSSQSPVASSMERISREQVDINVKAPPGTSAERRGKKSPGVSLNMGANGACS